MEYTEENYDIYDALDDSLEFFEDEFEQNSYIERKNKKRKPRHSHSYYDMDFDIPHSSSYSFNSTSDYDEKDEIILYLIIFWIIILCFEYLLM